MNKVEIIVVHNPSLPERRVSLEKVFRTTNIKRRFLSAESYPNFELLQGYRGGCGSRWDRKVSGLWTPAPVFRSLSRGELYATATHYLAYALVTEQWVLVLEDDALLLHDTINEIDEMIDVIPQDIEIVFVGGGCPHELVSRTIRQSGKFHYKSHPATNTSVAYLLRKSLCTKLVGYVKEIDLPHDFEFATSLRDLNVSVLHRIPYLIDEGSKGSLQSSLR
jgi:GR25 family glycosyltransferase involved in LPS biosynthesis